MNTTKQNKDSLISKFREIFSSKEICEEANSSSLAENSFSIVEKTSSIIFNINDINLEDSITYVNSIIFSLLEINKSAFYSASELFKRWLDINPTSLSLDQIKEAISQSGIEVDLNISEYKDSSDLLSKIFESIIIQHLPAQQVSCILNDYSNNEPNFKEFAVAYKSMEIASIEYFTNSETSGNVNVTFNLEKILEVA